MGMSHLKVTEGVYRKCGRCQSKSGVHCQGELCKMV